jgi:hypothetical protein
LLQALVIDRREFFMRHLIRAIYFTTVFLFASSIAFSQTSAPEARQGSGSISGRVTMSGAPARGVTVMVMREDEDHRQVFQRMSSGLSEVALKTKTDEDGQFRFADLVAAKYRVFVYAPSMVGVKSSTPSPQKVEPPKPNLTVNKDEEDEEDEESEIEAMPVVTDSPSRYIELADEQAVENINFSLTRGGVITGRITYADGRPVIGEAVLVSQTQGAPNSPTFQLEMNAGNFTTDDRGMFRVYGLADGRYKISVDIRGVSSLTHLANSANRKRTYHPDVTDEAAATIIDVTSGSEVRNIDIKIGAAGKTYVVTGRVVEAETGKPLPDVSIVYEKARNSGAEGRGSNGLAQANAKGEFRLEGVVSGSYVVYTLDGLLKQSDFYGEPSKFEVKDGNLGGVELKMRRGATISGVVTLDGTSNPQTLAKLALQTLSAASMDEKSMNARDDQDDEEVMGGFSLSQSPISPDGGFLLKGLKAGKVQIGMGNFMSESPFAISRIERSGVELQGGLEVRQGENISDVRIIVAQRNCVIRGQVRVEGGALPKNLRLQVSASRVQPIPQQGFPNLFDSFKGSSTTANARGEFKFEGLIPGEYEVSVVIGGELDLDDDDPRPAKAQQTVMVSSESEAEVTLVLSLKTKKR